MECIKTSPKIKITCYDSSGEECLLVTPNSSYDTRKLCHDIGLAVQDFLNNKESLRKWSAGGGHK